MYFYCLTDWMGDYDDSPRYYLSNEKEYSKEGFVKLIRLIIKKLDKGYVVSTDDIFNTLCNEYGFKSIDFTEVIVNEGKIKKDY